MVSDQELNTQKSTGVIYWEGAVTGKGTSGGKAVSCDGYVELTGYAGSLGGIF
jgi:predicted secreted hydrolase